VRTCAGSITYTVANYPVDQFDPTSAGAILYGVEGWTLSGTITTDGKTGVLTGTDITSLNLYTNIRSVAYGAPPYAELSELAMSITFNSGGTPIGIWGTSFLATETQLLLPTGSELAVEGGGSGITWCNYPGSEGYYWAGGSLSTGDSCELWDIDSAFLTQINQNDPWIIAENQQPVPEPSTLTMFLGLGGCGIVGWWRKRRAAWCLG
jgi:hypothetical protein